ncbi:MAG TPA: hypothetical protein VEQ16_08790 [Acidocella sp.]|nr:hypothetical protein [Acidocella sp.]
MPNRVQDRATQAWLPAKFIWLNILPLLCMAAGLALAGLLPQGPEFHFANPGAITIFFDGRWYENIARHGYHWDPAHAASYADYQNAAFFPLYPFIERLLLAVPGAGSQYGLSALSLGFGLWSNLAFSRFALRLFPEARAFWASAFFACWLASCFLWMGYPTGLINLCVIYCLQDYLAGRHFRAAFWCGLGSAAAPTPVFVAAALCVHGAFEWMKDRAGYAGAGRLILFGLLSVGGLLAFMALLFFEFHDPLVFLKAQNAWVVKPPLAVHLLQFLNPVRYLIVFVHVAHIVGDVACHHLLATAIGRDLADIIFQFLLGFLTVSLGIFGIVVTYRHAHLRPICLASAFVILGYLWFVVSTDSYFYNGVRLCYPALALFLGLADWAAVSKARPCAILGIFIILAIAETALTKAGYSVI